MGFWDICDCSRMDFLPADVLSAYVFQSFRFRFRASLVIDEVDIFITYDNWSQRVLADLVAPSPSLSDFMGLLRSPSLRVGRRMADRCP
jgi:hypothetical protein